MATVISGKGGAVDGSNTVRDWSVEIENAVATYHASGGSSGQGAIAGNNDWSGQYNAYGYLPDVLPGEAFEFKGSVDGSVGVVSAASGALCNEVVINFPIEEGGIINHTVSFEANGALTPGAAVATDAIVPDAYSAKDATVALLLQQTPFTETDETDVRSITITITSTNPAYRSSSTSGETKRVAGNLSATVSYSVYVEDGDPSNLPSEGDIKQLKVKCAEADNQPATGFTNDEWWDFKWMIYSGTSGIECSPESGDIIGATCNWTMKGFADVAGTQTKGFINKPLQTPAAFWP